MEPPVETVGYHEGLRGSLVRAMPAAAIVLTRLGVPLICGLRVWISTDECAGGEEAQETHEGARSACSAMCAPHQLVVTPQRV